MCQSGHHLCHCVSTSGLELFITLWAHMRANTVLKDWASGHWPGFVHMCVWMRVSCLGLRGAALGQGGTGTMVTGHKAHQDPRRPSPPPHRGHTAWTRDGAWVADGCSHRRVHLLAWGRVNEINSSVISVIWLKTRWSADFWGGNKMWSVPVNDTSVLHSHSFLHFYLPSSSPPIKKWLGWTNGWERKGRTLVWVWSFSHPHNDKKRKKNTSAMRFSLELLSPRSSEGFPTDMKEPHASNFKGNADGASKSPIRNEKCPRTFLHSIYSVQFNI